MNSILSVNEYSIFCYLGCLPKEREQTQEVRASIKIAFQKPPNAAQSDLLADTICYAQLCEEMKRIANAKSFNTVEHLCWEIYSRLEKFIPNGSRWNLVLQKVRPPVDGLKSGVCFQIGDTL